MTSPTPTREFSPSSQSQRQSWLDGTTPETEEVADNVWAIALPMPGEGMPSSFGYASVSDDGVDILDAGWKHDLTVHLWEQFLHSRGAALSDLRTVTLTHHHPDHLGAAGLLREATGAKVRMSGIEYDALALRLSQNETLLPDLEAQLRDWGVPDGTVESLAANIARTSPLEPCEPDLLIEHGDRLSFGTHTLTTIITPGHTAGHACFVDESERFIFTGDHVLPGIAPGMALGRVGDEDPLTDYLEALAHITIYDHCEVLPGHEYRFQGLAHRARQIAEHHLRRSRALADLSHDLGEANVWEYAKRVPWSRGWERLDGFLLLSALRQTEQHLFSLRSGRLDPWLSGAWEDRIPSTAPLHPPL